MYVYICMHVFIYKYICTLCTDMHIYVYIFLCIYIYYIYIYIYIYVFIIFTIINNIIDLFMLYLVSLIGFRRYT